MSISKTYNPREAEKKWYNYWLEHNFFHSEPDEREPYSIVIPPPNVTGVLHMGHMLNNTIQDVLIRRARMKGFNACWVPGTDHASIATEAKVVQMLREKGVSKQDIGRDKFMEHAWEWKEKYGGIILEQLKKLGASCDWDRTHFTMDAPLSDAVVNAFIHLHKKGLLYRGLRMVNWDPQGLTAVSDEEVIRKEVNQQLYYVKYKIVGESGFVTIATTRPETIMADTGVCINPKDERFLALHGKKLMVPLVNREVPIVLDEYVEMDFGTGCLKVTPAHDTNDYELGQKHGLEIIDIFNEDATLNEKAQILIGDDRFVARKKVVKLLKEADLLEKTEDYKSQVGFSERTNAAIEPRLSLQWFVKMKDLAQPALQVVEKGEVALIPDKFINTYRHWMGNVKDWCISRQLWWGQRIPAWYDEKGNYVVAKTEIEARDLFAQSFPGSAEGKIKQDDDVMDTWFSSWLWPITVFDPSVIGDEGNNGNADLNYYYPTNDVVTAPEILFFWVARMIMAGKEFRNEIPFKNVYLTGIVRDKQGRKMSKSLGNSPDPLKFIEKYGADGVRVGMLLSSPAGNDLLFDESYCEQGRNFSNKVWNAFRLIKGWEVQDTEQPEGNKLAIEWFESKFNAELKNIEQLFEQYRLSDALMAVYKLVWDDFCSWYLEMVKPAYGSPVDSSTYRECCAILEKILKILHPFMPFISEELWHELQDREPLDAIIVADYPQTGDVNSALMQNMTKALDLISQVRSIRNSKGLSPKEALPISINSKEPETYKSIEGIIVKLANISAINYLNGEKGQGISFMVQTDEFFVDLGGNIDVEKEKERIIKELEYQKGFLKAIAKKLENKRFVDNAPANVVEMELQKKVDAETKISTLQENLENLAQG